ncbi:MAG: HAD hydrolase-like protein [Pseudomonadota bacterium]
MAGKLKAIIFDLDGTIADSFHIGLAAANELAEKYKYQTIHDSPVIRDLSFKEFLVSHLKLGGIRLILWAREVRRILNQKNDDVKIFSGIKDMLIELSKHYRLGILTSNSTINVLKILKNNEIDNFFNFMYTKCPPFGKSRHLKKLIRRECYSKLDVVYVGDEIRDIDSCIIAGVPIIAVTWGANSEKILRETGANYYAVKPWDIVTIASEINSPID